MLAMHFPENLSLRPRRKILRPDHECPASFFAELKRRNVIRMAGLYLVGAWLLIQVASTMLPAFDVPAWALRGLIITLALGFTPALIFSWVFEMTPQGLKRDEDVVPEQSIAPQTARRMDRMIIVVLLLALGYFAFDKFVLGLRREAARSHSAPDDAKPTVIPQKSIAVLPFENLSSDKENAYFAEGIQDEILTRLAKIGALKVISRTSTQQYQSKPGNLREIAQQLGVANILEGSVQKAGAAVHVNVQLIKAVTDDHLWAESYDRTLENIFGVEGEIAQTVAEALKAKLTGAEEKVLAQKPTSNPAAYDAYLQGMAQFRKRDDQGLKASQGSLEEAVRLDPQFAAAWAALSRTHSLLYFLSDATPARSAAAEKALAEAVGLQPELAETRLARAYLQYWVRRDYAGALKMMRQLRTAWPNNDEVLQAMAFISARLGKWKEGLDEIEQSMALNPKDIFTRIQALQIALATRDFLLALRMADDGLQIWPNNPNLLGTKAFAFQARGQLDEAESILANVAFNPADPDAGSLARMYQTWLRHDPAVALKFVGAYPHAADEKDPRFLLYWGILQEAAGQKDAARASYTRARDTFAALVRAEAPNAQILGTFVFTLAALGQREDALHALDQLIALSAGDARSTGSNGDLSARVFARFGEKKRAIASLERVLSAPCDGIFGVPLTPAILRLDPDFDSLRGEPGFQKLLKPMASDEKGTTQ